MKSQKRSRTLAPSTSTPALELEDLAIVALPEREAMTLCGGLQLCVSVRLDVDLGSCCTPCHGG
jgi:hypothetical protein